MDVATKLAMLKVLVDVTGNAKDAALTVYLNLAGEKIIHKAFPYDDTQTTVPTRYDYLQCEIAAFLWNKRGAEGQTSHSENGISRQYESADVPDPMLKEVIPFCGTVKRVVSG